MKRRRVRPITGLGGNCPAEVWLSKSNRGSRSAACLVGLGVALGMAAADVKAAPVGHPRKTLAEYAKATHSDLASLEMRFAATGQLRCAFGTGSAQLTGKSSIITTAAHILYEGGGLGGYGTCSLKGAVENCTFSTQIRGRVYTSRVKRILADGYKCPRQLLRDRPIEDWAILELSTSVPVAKPYDIEMGAALPPGENVTMVAGVIRDLVRRDGRVMHNPKVIQDCKVTESSFASFAVETDCISVPGDSGGSLLRVGKNKPTLAGIVRAVGEDHVGPTTGYLTISGNFAEALVRVLRSSN